jgi:hypothetical protein
MEYGEQFLGQRGGVWREVEDLRWFREVEKVVDQGKEGAGGFALKSGTKLQRYPRLGLMHIPRFGSFVFRQGSLRPADSPQPGSSSPPSPSPKYISFPLTMLSLLLEQLQLLRLQ